MYLLAYDWHEVQRQHGDTAVLRRDGSSIGILQITSGYGVNIEPVLPDEFGLIGSMDGFIAFLMKGQVTTAFTGRQGSGKTTMMTSAIEFMDPRHNLRVIEMAFEMNLREHYPERNIMTMQETEYLDAHHAQDAQKKSDGAILLKDTE